MSRTETLASFRYEITPETHTPEDLKWAIEHKWKYAHPFKDVSWDKIREANGPGIQIKGMLVFDDGQERRYFDKRGHEVRRETYRRINPNGKPHLFDIDYWENSEYDETGYLTKVTAMTFGIFKLSEPGFIRTIKYQEEFGRHVPSTIITQPVDRQGVIELGKPIGNPHIIDLTKLPLIFPTNGPVYSM